MLVDERNSWRDAFKQGDGPDMYYLDLYRENRNSESWRMSRTSELLCEYVLYLESKIEELGGGKK
jgi:hypothetical protein